MRRCVLILVSLAFLLSSVPLSPVQAQTFRPVVRGKRGVVAGGHPLSVEAGLRVLQKGGNAVDAGVATFSRLRSSSFPTSLSGARSLS